jgi:hypothetical protein
MLTVFSIYQYVKNKLEKTEEGTAAYDALWDVYHFIRVNMNSSYGGMVDLNIPSQVPEELTEEDEMKKFSKALERVIAELKTEDIKNENIH